jgi:hypothetical protein
VNPFPERPADSKPEYKLTEQDIMLVKRGIVSKNSAVREALEQAGYIDSRGRAI